ncbi:phosphopantetheine-binding protein [Nocardiopsis dassonvillei]|uniref:phosphopantetheine-binding protein n=1 Tax=Nocardiopsis dassonvillei TaxID=2014 RepID=UPI0020A34DE6|nr:phosphopantetheine-binding protein [Nocardiopsis dassonvillei]MCP3012427.1 phosphopantetheine-binding protein [Nocardiopsis dassonvillei]
MSEQPAATALNSEFETVLRRCLDDRIAPETPLREDSDLTAFGMDSLTVVRLLVTIEDVFGVTIPDEELAFEIFASPGALWTVVSGLLEEAK